MQIYYNMIVLFMSHSSLANFLGVTDPLMVRKKFFCTRIIFTAEHIKIIFCLQAPVRM